jgi:hypothetical protein
MVLECTPKRTLLMHNALDIGSVAGELARACSKRVVLCSFALCLRVAVGLFTSLTSSGPVLLWYVPERFPSPVHSRSQEAR